jgi:hypothetical protein
MNHTEFLEKALMLVDVRGEEYGDLDENFERIISIFDAMTGIGLTCHEAALFLVAVKMARLKTSPDKADTYADAINYLAFAGQFGDAK